MSATCVFDREKECSHSIPIRLNECLECIVKQWQGLTQDIIKFFEGKAVLIPLEDAPTYTTFKNDIERLNDTFNNYLKDKDRYKP